MKKKIFLTLLLSLIATVCCIFGLTACKTNKDNTVAVTGVTLSSHTLSIAPGRTETLSATIAPENATDKTVTWVSSNEAVATVSQEGVVTAVTEGTANITVTTKDGNKTDTCAVTVETVNATAVAVDKTTLSLEAGTTGTLSAVFTPANTTNKNVTWSSDNTDVATISKEGVVTAFEKGTATITVTAEDGGFTATCTVNVVGKLVTDITLDKNTLAIKVGGGSQLTATVAPSDADIKTVIWSSSNQAVATVSEDGVVTAVSAGTAKIIATAVGGNITAECNVTVSNPTYSIHVKYAEGAAVGEGFKLKIDNGAELTTDADGNVSAQLAPATHNVAFTTMPVQGMTATYTITTTVDNIGDGVDLILTSDGTGTDRETARTLTAGTNMFRIASWGRQTYKYTPASNELITLTTALDVSIYDNANYNTTTNIPNEYITLTNGKAEFTGGATYYITFMWTGDATVTGSCNVNIHTHTYSNEYIRVDNTYHGHPATCADVCGTTTVGGIELHDYTRAGEACTLCNATIQALEGSSGISYWSIDGETAYTNAITPSVPYLTEIVIPERATVYSSVSENYEEKPVTKLQTTFQECSKLEVIYLPATLQTISAAVFRSNTNNESSAVGCYKLHTVYIYDLEAWCQIDFQVQSANTNRYGSAPFRHSGWGSIFLNYKPLVNANINVNISAAAFYNVTSLETVTLGNDVTSIGNFAFAGCTNLKSIVIGENVSVGANTFTGCSSDLKIYYKGTLAQWEEKGVALPEGATVYVYETNESLNVTGNYWHYEADNTTVKAWHHDYVLPSHSHEHTEEYFYNKSGHWYTCTWVDPDNTAEGLCGAALNQASHSMNGDVCTVCGYNKNAFTDGLAFELSTDQTYAILAGIGEATLIDGEMSIPTTVTIDGKVYPVSEIKTSAFANNTELVAVKFNGAITLNQKAFSGCTNLTTLYINAAVTVNQSDRQIRSYPPFQNCDNLKNVYANSLETWQACTWLYNSSNYCGPFVNVANDNKLYINEVLFTTVSGVTEIPAYSYYRIASITSVDLTGVTSVGSNAFSGCLGITEITIDTLANWFAFAANVQAASPFGSAENAVLKVGGTAITSFNASAYGLTEIPNYAFYGVKTLTSVDLTGVTTIGSNAFYNTGISGSFTVGESITSIGSYAFAGTQISELTVNAAISLSSSQFNCDTLTKATFNADAYVASTGIGTKIQSLYLNSGIRTGSNAFASGGSAKMTITGVYVPSLEVWFDCSWSNNGSHVNPFGSSNNKNPKLYVKNGNNYELLTRFVASDYNITELPKNALYGWAFLTYIDLTGVTKIGEQALYGIDTPIIIDGSSLQTIDSSAFYGVYNSSTYDTSGVTLIVKGNAEGVTVASNAIPYYSYGVANVKMYYYGTQAEYEASGWNNLTNFTAGEEWDAKITAENTFFYSATEQSGCWHYAADGVTPVLW